MTRDKAIQMVRTIISTRLEMHGADLGERGQSAVANTVEDLRGLINEIYDGVDELEK